MLMATNWIHCWVKNLCNIFFPFWHNHCVCVLLVLIYDDNHSYWITISNCMQAHLISNGDRSIKSDENFTSIMLSGNAYLCMHSKHHQGHRLYGFKFNYLYFQTTKQLTLNTFFPLIVRKFLNNKHTIRMMKRYIILETYGCVF